MIRNTTNGDISDNEFEAVLKPFLVDYDNFIYSYVMPEIISYYIANTFNRNSIYSGMFDQQYNSAKVMFNLFGEDYKTVKAEVEQIRLHDYRHSCASLLIYKGASINMVSKFLGHSKIEETLKTYSQLFTSTLYEVVALIDNLDNNKTDDV